MKSPVAFVLLFLSSITSITQPFDAMYKPLWEVLKSTGIGQKSLQYPNDIKYLISNGNEWALTAALSLKYGYNPFDDKPIIHLKSKDVFGTTKDFTLYRAAVQQTKWQLVNERRKNESSCQKLIIKGSVITAASIIGLMILQSIPFPLNLALNPITMPLSFLAIACAIYGAKKIYDGVYYQNHLENRMKQNEAVAKVVEHAAKQIANNTEKSLVEEIKNFPKTFNEKTNFSGT